MVNLLFVKSLVYIARGVNWSKQAKTIDYAVPLIILLSKKHGFTGL